MHRWINFQLKEGKISRGKILSFGDNESFFLDLPLSVPENEISASSTVFKSDFKGFIQEFDLREFHYILVPPSQNIPLTYGQRWVNDPSFPYFFRKIHRSKSGYTLYQRI